MRVVCLAPALVLAMRPLTAEAHKVGSVDYGSWVQPRNGDSCCGGVDCAPVPPIAWTLMARGRIYTTVRARAA
jgi:hypothetical protein